MGCIRFGHQFHTLHHRVCARNPVFQWEGRGSLDSSLALYTAVCATIHLRNDFSNLPKFVALLWGGDTVVADCTGRHNTQEPALSLEQG